MADEQLKPVLPEEDQDQGPVAIPSDSDQGLVQKTDDPAAPVLYDPEEEEGGPVKTFLEHLEDLRWVIIKCIASVLLGMVICLVATPHLVDILNYPLLVSGVTAKPVPLSPIGGFVISMKIALYGGLTMALPFLLFFVGQYIMPALKKNEKKYFLRAFIIGAGLFMAGVMLCYFFILPISFRGLTEFNKWIGLPTEVWRAEDYFHFVILFMMGMGASFEIPVLILTMVRIGVISHETLVKSRAYIFIGNMVFCAFITPDAVSTIFMVVPVQILMEICILISKSWERKKRITEAEAFKAGKLDKSAG